MPLEPKEIRALKTLIQRQTDAVCGPHYRDTERMMQGDMWLEGAGWVGPQPEPTNPKYGEVMGMIRRVFVSQNLIKEVSKRHRNAVAGDEPDWGLTPKQAPEKDGDGNPLPPAQDVQALIDEAEAALTDWWDKRGIWNEVKAAVLNAVAKGRGVLRLYIPAASLETDEATSQTYVPQGTLNETMLRIYLSSCDRSAAGTVKDDDGVTRGAFFYSARNGRSFLEWQYLNGRGETVVAVQQPGGDYAENTEGYPLGGNLLLFELERDPLISPQVISLQKVINKYLTMGSRNLDLAGFLKETILNGQMPGKWVPDPDNPGREIFQPDTSAKTGAGVREYIAPYVFEGTDGQKQVIPATLDAREPIDASRIQPTKRDTLEALYQEVSQLHVLMGGDATASGESRVQAVNEFRTSLNDTISGLEAMLRWLFGTVLTLAAHFSGDAAKYEALRPYAQATVIVTQPTAEDIRVDGEMVKDGRMSRETAMLRSRRVTDPAAEKRRIRGEQKERLDDPNARRDSIAGAVSSGLYSQQHGLQQEGLSPEDAQKVVAQRLQEEAQAQGGLPTGN